MAWFLPSPLVPVMATSLLWSFIKNIRSLFLCSNSIPLNFQAQSDQLTSEGLGTREATLKRLVDILDLAADEGCGLVFDAVPPTSIKRAPISTRLSNHSYKTKPGYETFFKYEDICLI